MNRPSAGGRKWQPAGLLGCVLRFLRSGSYLRATRQCAGKKEDAGNLTTESKKGFCVPVFGRRLSTWPFFVHMAGRLNARTGGHYHRLSLPFAGAAVPQGNTSLSNARYMTNTASVWGICGKNLDRMPSPALYQSRQRGNAEFRRFETPTAFDLEEATAE